MIIRKMLPEELDIVVNLFQYYREVVMIEDEDYDESRVAQTIKTYDINWNMFFNVAFEGQRPIGVIGGFITEDPIDGKCAAAIQFCYLLEKYASLTNYRQLVDTFEGWAREVNASSIKCLDIGNKPNRLEDLYSQLGYNKLPITIMGKEIR
jgi:hypothetical protein